MRGLDQQRYLLVGDDAGRGEQDHVERGGDPVRDVQGHPEEDSGNQIEQANRGSCQL